LALFLIFSNLCQKKHSIDVNLITFAENKFMSKTTNIEELRKVFERKNIIKLNDIDAFYREKEPSIPKTTVNWRVYALVQGGILQRVGKGLYRFGKTELFVPEITYKIKSISQLINKQFPFISYPPARR
jgi:hypothetical protein